MAAAVVTTCCKMYRKYKRRNRKGIYINNKSSIQPVISVIELHDSSLLVNTLGQSDNHNSERYDILTNIGLLINPQYYFYLATALP